MGRIKDLATQAYSPAGTDFEDLDDPTLGSRKIRTFDKLGGFVNSRSTRDVLYYDGLTANARSHTPLGTAGAITVEDFMVLKFIRVPTAAASADRGIGYIGATNTSSNTAGSMTAAIRANVGALGIRAGSQTNWRKRESVENLVASYGGQWVSLAWGRVAGVPVAYINGNALTWQADTTQGTPPAWTDALSPTFLVEGIDNSTQLWTGPMTPGILVNASLSAVEVMEWAQTGRLPTWCELGTGSMVARYTFNGTTTDSWTNDTATLAVFDVNTTVAGQMYFQLGASGYTRAARAGTLTVGRKYRLTLKARLASGTGVALSAGTGTVVAFGTPTGVQATYSVEFVADGPTVRIGATASNSSAYEIDDISILELGPIFKPVIQPIAVVADSSDNKLAGVLIAGVIPITDKRDWIIQALTNTSGNQQILGASVFFDFLKVVIDDWWINNGGTSKTVSLGNASAGAQYQSAGTFAAGRVKATLLTQVPATNNLWVNSNGTDALRHTIRGYLVD